MLLKDKREKKQDLKISSKKYSDDLLIIQGPYSQNFLTQICKNLCNFNLDFRTNFTSKIGILLLII
jgi:hypothetical protein